MKLFYQASGLFVMMALSCPSNAEILSIYLSTSFDEQNGSAYAYANTTIDYTGAYYYGVCTQVGAFAEDGDSGNFDYYYGGIVCGGAEAEVSWPFSVPTSTVLIEFMSDHTETFQYYTYEFEPQCYYNCYDFWDGFGMSMLGNNGQIYSQPQSWELPGPPGFSTAYAMLTQSQARSLGTPCYYPSYETTTYVAPEVDPDFYGAEFTMLLDDLNGQASYVNRKVTESFSSLTETCWSTLPHQQFLQPTIASFGTPSIWTVNSDGKTWGSDFLGWRKTEVNHYQSQLPPNGSCVMFSDQQTVKLNGCSPNSNTYRTYETHTNTYVIETVHANVTRDGATGYAK